MKRIPQVVLAIALGASMVGAVTAGPVAAAPDDPIYLDRAYSPVERAADLVSRLTLAEKATQMNSSQAAAIARLGVEAYVGVSARARAMLGVGRSAPYRAFSTVNAALDESESLTRQRRH